MLQRKTRKDAASGRADVDLGILESSSVVAAVAVAADGTILAANARMRRLLGLREGALGTGKTFGEHLADAAAWAACCDAARAGRGIEIDLRCSDGATKRLRGDLRAEGEGAERRFVGILVDGDDDKALRAAAQHSARMEALGSLTAGVAHDFNNLLTVLVGNLYLVGEELRERPLVFEKLKAARDAGKRGSELIKQLMTFARREELEVGTIDPSKVVGDLLPLLRRALGSRITLETTLQ
ncbi:MAG TPA: histidine kinase dimerization/phospho-acceptor domain-containing protein, partial [Gammaproteobacteria bacterium]|nr:histidine kinase dimerization/phospho-acceptor domain-containing protein [Gammaproteobacteria bacterium]